MLWSRNDRLFCIAVMNGEHPRTPAPTDDGPRQTMEPAVGHTLLDAWVNNDVNLRANIEFLDNGGDRRQSALS